jgi:hypothetical protein
MVAEARCAPPSEAGATESVRTREKIMAYQELAELMQKTNKLTPDEKLQIIADKQQEI